MGGQGNLKLWQNTPQTVRTLGTGAGVIRHKQEAAGFGPQQPQRRSHSASEAAATAVLT